MVNAILVCRPRFKALSFHELRGPLLEEAATEIKKLIEEQKKNLAKERLQLVNDGWIDIRGRSLLNFLVSSGGLGFLPSTNASRDKNVG